MKIVTMQDIIELAQQKTVQTLCKDCAFAECEENSEGRLSQTGCKVQRFDKLENNGAELLKVEDETQESDFVVIQDRICNMLRGPEWKSHWEQIAPNIDSDGLSAIARKEIQLRCTVLIYLGPGQNIKDAYMTAQEIQKQSIPATNTVIVNNAGIMPSDFLEGWRALPSLGIPWSMEYVVEFQHQEFLDIFADAPEDEKEELRERMLLRCIDIGVKRADTIYYAFFNAGDSIPVNYLLDIDEAINDELIRVLALNPENKSYSGLFMQCRLHSQIGGNKERPCIDKVITQTENQECPSLVLPLTKIVKNFDSQ